MKILKYLLLVVITLTMYSCKMSYSFSGISLSPETKTFQVNYFQNEARLIEPGIDLQFTLALQDLILNQTSLDLVTSNGDIVYEGEIVEYRIAPTTATAQNTAAQNRLTIAINVRFIDKNDMEAEFEKRFSFFYDYPGSSQLTGSIRDTALEEIFDRITQDIINASLANW